MICDLCGQDRPGNHMRSLAFVRLGWPPIRFTVACRACRRGLKRGVLHRAFACLCYVGLYGAVATIGFGIVCLVLWIVRRVSTS